MVPAEHGMCHSDWRNLRDRRVLLLAAVDFGGFVVYLGCGKEAIEGHYGQAKTEARQKDLGQTEESNDFPAARQSKAEARQTNLGLR